MHKRLTLSASIRQVSLCRSDGDVGWVLAYEDTHIKQCTSVSLETHRIPIGRHRWRLLHLKCDVGPVLQRAQLLKTAGLPAVYAEWLHAGKDAPTVLIYGHYGEKVCNDLLSVSHLCMQHQPVARAAAISLQYNVCKP